MPEWGRERTVGDGTPGPPSPERTACSDTRARLTAHDYGVCVCAHCAAAAWRGVVSSVAWPPSEKLGVPGETVEHGVQGLMYLLTESSKLLISELDFHDSIVVLGFPDELNSSLLKLYLDNRMAVRDLLERMSMKLPQYKNMKWRLDAQVASRTLRRQAEPTVVLQLETVRNNKRRAIVIRPECSFGWHGLPSLCMLTLCGCGGVHPVLCGCGGVHPALCGARRLEQRTYPRRS